LPGNSAPETASSPTASPVPVRIIDSHGEVPHLLQTAVGALLSPLGRAGLVLLLVIFMLFKREDLRGRLIRLIGQGRITETTRAMDDAGRRVGRYLSMQLLVNAGYGVLISVGLYFIGVPNAMLWGAFAAVTRFIPYVGPWLGAAIPVLLSLAVSTGWLKPISTLSLFCGLELIISNLLEPWLYGSSTGVSSIALIIAAVFWTWLWGPMGLVLSTPLTVCVAVMGRHVAQLNFLSVLLSEDRPLSPAEECYHRLLSPGSDQANQLAEAYFKENSLGTLYGTMFLPVVLAAEADVHRNALEPDERSTMYENLTDMIEDFGTRPVEALRSQDSKSDPEEMPPSSQFPTCRVLCVPARAERDGIAGLMLTLLLRQENFEADNIPSKLPRDEIVERAAKLEAEAICISVVPPTTFNHARYLTRKLRKRLPQATIVVGLWDGTGGLGGAAEALRSSGADEVAVSFDEAITQISKFSVDLSDEMIPAPIPDDEEKRLTQLAALQVIDTPNEEFFDRMTGRLRRLFQVPVAYIAFIDRERQWFKAHEGLPNGIAQAGSTAREISVCGHMVANNEMLVVEDIARDRRFANNPLLKEHGLRFYAGAPLRVNKLPVGSICLLDVKPRKFSEENRRVLQVMADEVMAELNQRLPKLRQGVKAN
jgi:hypothetical protein